MKWATPVGRRTRENNCKIVMCCNRRVLVKPWEISIWQFLIYQNSNFTRSTQFVQRLEVGGGGTLKNATREALLCGIRSWGSLLTLKFFLNWLIRWWKARGHCLYAGLSSRLSGILLCSWGFHLGSKCKREGSSTQTGWDIRGGKGVALNERPSEHREALLMFLDSFD